MSFLASAGLAFPSIAESDVAKIAKLVEAVAKNKIAYPCSNNKMFYCFSSNEDLSDALDAYASYIRRTRDGGRVMIRLWRREGSEYMIVRGYAPILSKLGYYVLDFAPWIEVDVPTRVGSITLRDYQSEVVFATLVQLRHIGSATQMVATGGGKTYILLSVYDSLRQIKPIKAVWLTLSKDLILQARDMAHKAGIKFGVIYGDEYQPNQELTGITVQSAYYAITGKQLKLIDYPTKRELVNKREAIVELIKSADLIIFDESQHIPAKSVLAVMRANPNALIVSASGTPKRNDSDTPLIYALSGHIVPRVVTSSELIQRGFLVRPYIFMLKNNNGCRSGGRGVKRFMELRKCIELSRERALLIAKVVDMLHSLGIVPVMVHVNMIASCKLISNTIKSLGIYAICVSSEVNEKIRNAIFNAVRSGKLHTIVVTPLGREGLDLPNVRALVIASGGKSVVSVPQTVGRVLRSAPGKQLAIVVDIFDTDGVFKLHGLERKKMYTSEPLWYVDVVNSINELEEKIAQVIDFELKSKNLKI